MYHTIKPYIFVLRPKQWVKNIFILFPAFFSGVLFSPEECTRLLLIVSLFSFFSGATYIFNDLIDQEKDKLHPKKKYRPIARGDISKGNAVLWMLFLLSSVSLLAFWYFGWKIVFLFLAYLLYTLAYSLWIKKQVILDVFGLSIGFILRILIGASVITIEPSFWLLLMVFFMSLWFGFSKRYQESMLSGETRAVLSSYSREFLSNVFSLLTGVLMIIYALYVYEEKEGTYMLFSIPIFSFIVLEYFYQVHDARNRDQGIEDILLSDHKIIAAILLYGVVTLLDLFHPFLI